jgi:hypothetical protein
MGESGLMLARRKPEEGGESGALLQKRFVTKPFDLFAAGFASGENIVF